MPLSKLEALRLNEWNRMIDVNIRGVLHGIAAALPVMQAQHHGQFINVASIGAHQVSPTAAVYSATKHAVWAISEGLRQEVGGGPCHHQGLLGEADADARRRRYAGARRRGELGERAAVRDPGWASGAAGRAIAIGVRG